jgi:hypothetical protein
MSILRRIRALVSRTRVEQEIQDELRSHLEMRTRDNIAAGMAPEHAHRSNVVGQFSQSSSCCRSTGHS